MLIFLSLEIISILITFHITGNIIINSVLKFGKKCYKIKKKAIIQPITNQPTKESLGALIFFLPGMNIIYCLYLKRTYIKSLIDNKNSEFYLVKMTDIENEKYRMASNNLQRLNILTTEDVPNKINENKKNFIIKKLTALVEENTIFISTNQLPSLSYTFEEVKKFNFDEKNTDYVIGKVDGRNIAIIGIMPQGYKVDNILFKNENYETIHTFNTISEEEAVNSKFAVYHFIDELEENKILNKSYEEIRNNRNLSYYHKIEETKEIGKRLSKIL